MRRKFFELYYEVKEVITLFPSELWDVARMRHELISRGVRKNLTKAKFVEKVLWQLAEDQYTAVVQRTAKAVAFTFNKKHTIQEGNS